MQHDMLMRGLGSHTQQDYVRHVRRFAAFLGRSPDTATAADIRRFQLHQHESGVGPATINGAVSALRFLFLVTLKRRDLACALIALSDQFGLKRAIPLVSSGRISLRKVLCVGHSECVRLKVSRIGMARRRVRHR
ncbi:phage integrase N-terminal SAM-like domain-containing protein [Mesorhizobium sp. L103C119B0]|uniref:phage integrase N-terminal SAM-like domain-containing protein n=1 Tax=Mesorhizobium sp. L103C119B0 TaxID=1287085 RepID=UPI0009DDFE0C|nr:phage integrase N-terminal SAM-like domain-containing protein [Mesorhizobium sp. L103C119B0]